MARAKPPPCPLAALVATNPIGQYYAGAAALRQGDLSVAQAQWPLVASQVATPWLAENLLNLQRNLANDWAQEERWAEIIALQERIQLATLPPTQVADQPERTDGKMNGEVDEVLAEAVDAAYSHLGFAAAQQQDWQQAHGYWQKAYTLRPNRQLAQNLALSYEGAQEWQLAAENWREMIRRRPRKADHPDYLSEAQVTTLWQHIAQCY